MNRKIRFSIALLVPALILFAGACSRRTAETQKVPETPGSSELVVYTYDSFPRELQTSITDYFKTSHSVDVRIRRFEDTGGLYNALYLEKNSVGADAFIGLDNTFLARIYREDLLHSYRPEGLRVVSDTLIVDPKFRVVPFDFGGVVLNYNRKTLSEPPRTWEELLDPRFKSKIIVLNPATSGPGRNFLLFTIAVFGEEGYLDYWKKLKPNLLTVAAGWSEGYGLYTQGEAPIVLSYDTSPAYHREFEGNDQYDNLIFDDKAYAQVEVAGILKNSRNIENAERLIDFIVSLEFQNRIPLNQIMYPVHPDATLPESFRAVTRAKEFVNLDEERISGSLDKWLRDWEAVMR